MYIMSENTSNFQISKRRPGWEAASEYTSTAYGITALRHVYGYTAVGDPKTYGCSHAYP